MVKSSLEVELESGENSVSELPSSDPATEGGKKGCSVNEGCSDREWEDGMRTGDEGRKRMSERLGKRERESE